MFLQVCCQWPHGALLLQGRGVLPGGHDSLGQAAAAAEAASGSWRQQHQHHLRWLWRLCISNAVCSVISAGGQRNCNITAPVEGQLCYTMRAIHQGLIGWEGLSSLAKVWSLPLALPSISHEYDPTSASPQVILSRLLTLWSSVLTSQHPAVGHPTWQARHLTSVHTRQSSSPGNLDGGYRLLSSVHSNTVITVITQYQKLLWVILPIPD